MLASRAIERAYREAAIRPIGATLTTAEYEEGLERLNGFLFSLFGAEIGQVLVDWPVPNILRTAPYSSNHTTLPFPSNLSVGGQPMSPVESPNALYPYYPPVNVRLIWGGQEAAEVYLPEYPTDGARVEIVDAGSAANMTLRGNGRRIDGGTSLTFEPGDSPVLLFYRADLASWFPIGQLTLSSVSPLPAEFDDLLVSGTAIRLTALDEISPQSGTMFIYERLLKRCQQRYKQPTPIAPNSEALRPTEQPYHRGWPGSGWIY